MPAARPSGFVDRYVSAVRWLSRLFGAAAAALIALGVLVICDMVVERYVFDHTTIWQIDVVTYSIVAAAFIGSPYVLLTRGHVNVDVLPLHLGPGARRWLAIATAAVALGFCGVLFVLCTAFWHEAWAGNWRSDTVWRARLWIPYAAMPLGLGLLVLQYVAELIGLVSGEVTPFGIGGSPG
ncbi:MAG TPA: TRAP transporter small permease [Burkholderiaceae bacterium]|nr:TRAP transporter small permease [Burkholderiaceae bacterium]